MHGKKSNCIMQHIMQRVRSGYIFHCRLPARFGFEFAAVIFDMKTPYTIDMMIPTPNVDNTAPIATGCSHRLMISLGPTNCNGAAVVVVVVDVVVEVATHTNTSHLIPPSPKNNLTRCRRRRHRCRCRPNRRASSCACSTRQVRSSHK